MRRVRRADRDGEGGAGRRPTAKAKAKVRRRTLERDGCCITGKFDVAAPNLLAAGGHLATSTAPSQYATPPGPPVNSWSATAGERQPQARRRHDDLP